MNKPIIAITALVLIAGCNEAAEATTETDTSMASDATAMEAETTSVSDAAYQADEAPQTAASERVTVSGTVDSLVLEVDPPIVMLTSDDGTQYIAGVAPSASDSVAEGTKGVGSQVSLDCKPMPEPEGAEPGYTWLEDCKLAG